MPVEGVWTTPAGKKVFIPLENNPEVFTSLVHDLGLSPTISFHDVYSIDEPSLLSMVPRPAHALIFITPAPMYYAVRKEDDIPQADDKFTYNGSGEQEPVLWFRQTIGNACGLYALIHAVANGEGRKFVQEGSVLDKIFKEATDKKPAPRAELLYNSEELEKYHMKAAVTGDSRAPQADDPCALHFLAFTKGKDGHLWELEGGCDGPVDRGMLEEGADMLSEEALDKGVRRFLKHADGNLEFSIVALAGE